jgi:hypothetical protein
MVQELVPFFPEALNPTARGICLIAVVLGVFLWLSGSVWSRGLVTLAAVTLGGLLGMYVPRWELWPINSMALAVLGAVGFGVSAYLVERLWMGLTLGFVLACWATLGTWMLLRPAEFVVQERVPWQVQHMTPPEYARDIYIRLPQEVRDVLPYTAATALLSGLAIAFLWPRLGRAIGMSLLGVTTCFVFGLALVTTQHPDWLQYIPPQPLSQAATIAGLVLAGLLAQWPFISRRVTKRRKAAAAPPPPAATTLPPQDPLRAALGQDLVLAAGKT